MKSSLTHLIYFILVLALTACGATPSTPGRGTGESSNTPQFASSPTSSLTPTSSSTQPPTETATLTPTLTSTPTRTSSPTITHTPTTTPTVTPSPTYAILRGKILEQANCRYGPGAMYLYKYGVYPDYVMDIIGRNEIGDWVVVQAIGGTNPCWVKASLIDIRGDVMTVAPMYLPLPRSPFYYPPTGVSATRDGNTVTVSWYAIKLRAGDDSEQTPYVVEAWVCMDGEIRFTPVGSWGTTAALTDEPGCSEPSHAQLLAAEKHGYTVPVEIPWP